MNTHSNTDTPTLSVMDPRSLAIRSVVYCRHPDAMDIEPRITRQVFDGAGRLIASWDPRLWGTAPKPNLTTVYGLSGQPVLTDSVDAGWQLNLLNHVGSLHSFWDGRGNQRQCEYDDQQRLLSMKEQAAQELLRVVERLTYGSSGELDAGRNQCGRLIRHDDPAGSQIINEYGLAGSVLVESRRFLTELQTPDWTSQIEDRNDWLEEQAFVTRHSFHPTGEIGRQTDALGNVRSCGYDVAGRLSETWLLMAGEGKQPQQLVSDIRYNAHGQVESEIAGNGVKTHAEYGADEGLLIRLVVTSASQKLLQDLNYTYDPVGNITELEDNAQPVTYFNNQRIEPINRYRYDSLSQLVEAKGWEVANPSHGPALPDFLPTPLDPNQRRTYTQRFEYDAAGNLITRHHSGAPGFSMFTSASSNRSLAQRDDGSLPEESDIESGFDACGNQAQLQRGQAMTWDIRNQLSRVTLVKRGDEPDDYECYVYDRPGHRLRKVHFNQTSSRTGRTEVRYLPSLELHRQADGEEHHVISIEAGRCSVRALHWPDGAHTDQLRYSLSDHLNSNTLELDHEAGLLTQEHYYPFGGTACWAGKSALVANYKTIRYSGKERDVTGLYYYGYRYYAPWLQRWIGPDPAGQIDGVNLFCMVGNSPIIFFDSAGTIRESISDDHASQSRMQHFTLHLASSINARKERDKELAINKIMNLMNINFAEEAGRILEGAVEVLSAAAPTFNVSPAELENFHEDKLINLWSSRHMGEFYEEARENIERSLFDYEHSPVDLIRRHGAVDSEVFNANLRPLYGALQIANHQGTAGGAPDYGAAALYVSEHQKKYMTLTGTDSAATNDSMEVLASFENLYPIISTLEPSMWKILHEKISKSEVDRGFSSFSIDGDYIEWQSHAPIFWQDIDGIVFSEQRDFDYVNKMSIAEIFFMRSAIKTKVGHSWSLL